MSHKLVQYVVYIYIKCRKIDSECVKDAETKAVVSMSHKLAARNAFVRFDTRHYPITSYDITSCIDIHSCIIYTS